MNWYANNATLVEEREEIGVWHLEGGRYLVIDQLSHVQRMSSFHCEVEHYGIHGIASTTYTLNTDIDNLDINVYNEISTQVGRVGEQLRFSYVAAKRDNLFQAVVFALSCPLLSLVTLSVSGKAIIRATLSQAAVNESEVTFRCSLVGAGINTFVMGTIIVDSKYITGLV